MAIKQTTYINSSNDLRRSFVEYNRGTTFSDEGYDALFSMLEDLGEDFELDVIGICCDYSEDTLENVLRDYDLESFKELSDNTYAVLLDNGNVFYQNY